MFRSKINLLVKNGDQNIDQTEILAKMDDSRNFPKQNIVTTLTKIFNQLKAEKCRFA